MKTSKPQFDKVITWEVIPNPQYDYISLPVEKDIPLKEIKIFDFFTNKLLTLEEDNHPMNESNS